FNKLMEAQKTRARAAQKREVIVIAESAEDVTTKFVGYDTLESRTNVRTTHDVNQEFFAIVDCSPLYAEMGGQVGDTGRLMVDDEVFSVSNTIKKGSAFYLK